MAPNASGERIQQLFLEAAQMPVEDRDEWLRGRCGDDDQLFDDVRSLLRYDDLPVDPLESGPTFSARLVRPVSGGDRSSPMVPGYKIVREIGTGGQAIVYEAIQESTTQRVALKMLRWGPMASTQERERLRREVLILARLRHPGIVSIIDSGETASGVFFIATQFVDGRSLDRLFGGSNDRPPADGMAASGEQGDLLRLFVKICTAVDAAHRAGVVHRDLKPANILIDELGEPRVLDFGLATPGIHESLDALDGIELTRIGQFMGSLPWASPEQAEGDQADVRSDIYSLGVILYQLLSGGRFPYDVSGSPDEVITKIKHADPTPLDRLTHGTRQIRAVPSAKLVDPKLNAIVLKALAKSPDNRYQSAAELAAAINEFCSGLPGDLHKLEVPTSASQQSWRRSRWLAVIVSLTVLATVIGFAVSGRFSPSADSHSSGSSADSADNAVSKESTAVSWRPIEVGDVDQRSNAHGEFAFPGLSADTLAIRGSVRLDAEEPVTVTLRSTEGTKLDLEIGKGGQLRLFVPGKNIADAISYTPDVVTNFVLAVLPDRFLVAIGKRWLMQLHMRTSGRWYPTIELHRAAQLRNLQYLPAPEVALPSVPRLPDEEQAALDFVLAVGGFASSIPGGEDANSFRVRTIVALEHEATRREDAELISRCRKVSRLKINRVSDDGIPYLAGLPMLEHLSIWNSALGAGCIEQISSDDLVGLDLWHSTVADADFSSLAAAKRLEYVGIPRIEVTDENLKQLAEIKTLRNLYANGRLVTPAGIKQLAELPHLEELELSGAQLSGHIAESFSKLQQLIWLNLRESDLVDADVKDLSELRHLRTLDVEGTNISQRGLQQLAELLPNCRISPTSAE